jgi:hypothetical protein
MQPVISTLLFKNPWGARDRFRIGDYERDRVRLQELIRLEIELGGVARLADDLAVKLLSKAEKKLACDSLLESGFGRELDK